MARLPRFLVDPNISNKLVSQLRAAGCEVERVEEVLGDNAPDSAVVAYAVRQYAVIVTKNTKHFNAEARKALDEGHRERRRWGLICVNCTEPRIAFRFQRLHEIILAEYQRASIDRHEQGLLLHMEINEGSYLIHY